MNSRSLIWNSPRLSPSNKSNLRKRTYSSLSLLPSTVMKVYPKFSQGYQIQTKRKPVLEVNVSGTISIIQTTKKYRNTNKQESSFLSSLISKEDIRTAIERIE